MTLRRSAILWVCVVAACAAAPGAAQIPAREAAYAALAQLPDWSGWWDLETSPTEEFRGQPAPIKPGLMGAPASPAERQGIQRRPPTFTGYNGGFQEAVELLFTPGRVTSLQIDVVVVAPDALTEPDRRTRVYTRLPTMLTFTHCTENDRSLEPDSGEARFDLTPPADLPPPPPR